MLKLDFFKGEIFLFYPSEDKDRAALKDFLKFVCYLRPGPTPPFCYPKVEGLQKHLTLAENLLLGLCSNPGPEKIEKFLLESDLGEKGHAFLNLFPYLDRPVCELPQKRQKLFSLFKGLLSKAPLIFLENPEQDLEPGQLEHFQMALNEAAAKSERAFFIHTNNPSVWKKTATRLVLKDKSHFQVFGRTTKGENTSESFGLEELSLGPEKKKAS